MKTSRFALAAAAGLLLGAAMTPAKAADLGGGCCADLEERVAELEATTARKGNRVVSLQVYGQVNKGLLIWDDGIQSDAFVVDNALASSRVGFKGKATIKPGWTAGYNMEFEINDSTSWEVTQGKNGDDPNGSSSTFILRQNNFWVESDRLGRLTVGQQTVAAGGAYDVVLGNSGMTSNVVIGNSFAVRTTGGGTYGTLGQWADNLDADNPFTGRNDVIRYDSPSIYGFLLSASWGDNDYADIALRFKKEFGSLRLAAAIAYQWDNQYDSNWSNHETFGGSISAMHTPTGLYASFQASSRNYKDAAREDASMWYLQGGIERKWMPYGSTTVYADYGKFKNTDVWKSDSSEAARFGFGINQKIDSAAMDIYAHAQFYSFDDKANTPIEDMSLFMVGSKISF